MFYGLAHEYGHTTGDSDGNHIAVVYRFARRVDRDEWMTDGADYDGPGVRTVAVYRDRADRKAILDTKPSTRWPHGYAMAMDGDIPPHVSSGEWNGRAIDAPDSEAPIDW